MNRRRPKRSVRVARAIKRKRSARYGRLSEILLHAYGGLMTALINHSPTPPRKSKQIGWHRLVPRKVTLHGIKIPDLWDVEKLTKKRAKRLLKEYP